MFVHLQMHIFIFTNKHTPRQKCFSLNLVRQFFCSMAPAHPADKSVPYSRSSILLSLEQTVDSWLCAQKVKKFAACISIVRN